MFENKKKINNPLSLLVIFSGIPIVSIYVMKYLNSEIQQIVIYFVISYTIGLTLMTFIMLFFKPENFYSPSDFKNEKFFIEYLKLRNNLKEKEQLRNNRK